MPINREIRWYQCKVCFRKWGNYPDINDWGRYPNNYCEICQQIVCGYCYTLKTIGISWETDSKYKYNQNRHKFKGILYHICKKCIPLANYYNNQIIQLEIEFEEKEKELLERLKNQGQGKGAVRLENYNV